MILIVFLILLLSGFFILVYRFNTGKKKIEEEWVKTKYKRIDPGSTKSLRILPLIDWYVSSKDLKGEAGVSYLIKTDETSILFDVGLNKDQSDPSPLLHNMKQLGISTGDFDTIVISHNHLDHTGGMKWQKRKSFSLTNHQVDLMGKRVFTPVPMNYPGLEPLIIKKPVVLASGVATTGTISNQDFFMGRIQEQALAIHVERKGIVLIVGCGHQTLPKVLERAKILFDQPIYGIIGGLHYPVTDSRIKILGIKMQKFFGICRPPWKPITMDLVHENILLLKELHPKIVGLSAHDSCDASIEAFRKAFPDAFTDIRVGKEIDV